MLSGVSLTNRAGYSAGSNLGTSVIQNSAKTALFFAAMKAIDSMPKAEAANMNAKQMKVRNDLIISLPCIVACLALGAAMPACIIFCAMIP